MRAAETRKKHKSLEIRSKISGSKLAKLLPFKLET
jgi:hypothetical protein